MDNTCEGDLSPLSWAVMSATPESAAVPSDPWHEDVLGSDFQCRDLHLGPDPEGEGDAVATVVRHRPSGAGADFSNRPALLWVSGMTDYFFQEHVARHFHDHGYAFYAVDLRKCGRARQEGQRWHYSTDLTNYFPDLTASLALITEAGHPSLTPIAHSTGGLVAPLWLDQLRRTSPARHHRIGGLVLNSPWLDMQYPDWLVRLLRPVLKAFGTKLPDLKIPGGNLGTYGASIHSSRHGEWDFDTRMKPLGGHPKYVIWLRAVLAGQAKVHRGEVDVGVPALTLCSTKSYLGQPYSAASDTADTVLDVDQIQRWAPSLGEDMAVTALAGARHDVFLSLPHAREAALTTSTQWLDERVREAGGPDVS